MKSRMGLAGKRKRVGKSGKMTKEGKRAQGEHDENILCTCRKVPYSNP